MKYNNNVTVVEHPVIARDLTILRDKETPPSLFRLALERIATVLAYDSLKSVTLRQVSVTTPIRETTGYEIEKEIVIVPILRAGLGMVDAIIRYIPEARVGHLGMYRDEQTHKPVPYYSKMPDVMDRAHVLVVDPMLATGGSASDAVNHLKELGARDLQFISIISASEGIDRFCGTHPDVPVLTAAVDEGLNDDAFIVPGLGDAGDRIFGTP